MDLLSTIVTHWSVAVPIIVSSALFVMLIFGVFDDGRIDL